VLVTFELHFSKSSGMTLDRLADTTVPAVQLHGALDLKSGGIGGVSRDTNEYEPLLISTAAVVDDLCADEGWMSIKHLLWRRRRVGRGPVIDSSFRHYSDGAIRYPLPEGDVLGISVGLDLGLGLNVEYLQCPTGCARNAVSITSRSHKRSERERGTRTFESQNLLVGMHNRGVGGDWPTQNIVGVVQVDDDNLVLFVDFLPHTDEMVGFQSQRLSLTGVNERP
jgi:hypothetical protein